MEAIKRPNDNDDNDDNDSDNDTDNDNGINNINNTNNINKTIILILREWADKYSNRATQLEISSAT